MRKRIKEQKFNLFLAHLQAAICNPAEGKLISKIINQWKGLSADIPYMYHKQQKNKSPLMAMSLSSTCTSLRKYI